MLKRKYNGCWTFDNEVKVKPETRGALRSFVTCFFSLKAFKIKKNLHARIINLDIYVQDKDG